eukprot:TRINITY_DN79157_c0_g1_i1.p1 TRINITY_DN79157_c0_g1~~TRINITY_DN79157_c0_g1_i1.p1  ORF type:complete len:178 (+),score=21.70 TRINITY_DN79157_c0_g1_i1:442-975(+)
MASEAQTKWKLPSLDVIGDPSLSLARHLKSSSMLDVFISKPDPVNEPWIAGHPFMSSYTNGCAQPATLVVSREREVWFAHTIIPSRQNGGGAVDRPYLGGVWQHIKQSKLHASGNATSAGSTNALRKQTLLDAGPRLLGLTIPLPAVILSAVGGVGLLVVYFLRTACSTLFRASLPQ